MTYNATVYHDGYNWIADLDGHPGAVTQARRIDQLRPHLVEVVKLMVGDVVTADDIDLHFEGFDDADELRTLRAEVRDIETALAERTPRVVAALRRQGFTVRDIGSIVGVSHQRVQQLLRR